MQAQVGGWRMPVKKDVLRKNLIESHGPEYVDRLNVLVKKFDIKPTATPGEDINEMLDLAADKG